MTKVYSHSVDIFDVLVNQSNLADASLGKRIALCPLKNQGDMKDMEMHISMGGEGYGRLRRGSIRSGWHQTVLPSHVQ
jgi:hypothetical protein